MAKNPTKLAFRVGLLGESPNDTKAVAALLAPRYPQAEFITLIDGITGDDLQEKSGGVLKLLRREYQYERPQLVLVIRDLDALETDKGQLRERRRYFREVNNRVDGKALFLLNIYSIEALIAADIDVFNDHYACACVVPGDVMHLVKPVELLKAATRPGKTHYKEADCYKLLAKVRYEQLLANCRYFRQFDADFAAQVLARSQE